MGGSGSNRVSPSPGSQPFVAHAGPTRPSSPSASRSVTGGTVLAAQVAVTGVLGSVEATDRSDRGQEPRSLGTMRCAPSWLRGERQVIWLTVALLVVAVATLVVMIGAWLWPREPRQTALRSAVSKAPTTPAHRNHSGEPRAADAYAHIDTDAYAIDTPGPDSARPVGGVAQPSDQIQDLTQGRLEAPDGRRRLGRSQGGLAGPVGPSARPPTRPPAPPQGPVLGSVSPAAK